MSAKKVDVDENEEEGVVDEETQERINALAAAYHKRMLKRVAEGKELPGTGMGRGRLPAGITEEDRKSVV